MKLSRFVTGFLAVALVAFVVTDALGQDQGRRGGGGRGPGGPGGFQGRGPGGPGGFGGFGGRPGGGDMTMALLRVEEVQTELEVSPPQKEALEKMAQQAREAFAGGDRPDFRNMSDADRTAFFEKMRKEAEERAAEMKLQLEEVLLPEQLTRLDEIALQVRGVQALEDPEVAGKLSITEAQKKKFAEVREGFGEKMRGLFQGGGGPGGFDREAFGKLREEMEKETLAVLDSGQQAKFEEMKGEEFEMPEGGLGRGGFGGGFGGRGGPGGPGGPGGGRPQRGGRPQAE